jgi:predicted Fe-S protein YdhL (DUF1289 family)
MKPAFWDFAPKLQPTIRHCRKGHEKKEGTERCAVCDRAREVALWQKLKDDPAAHALHNKMQVIRKAARKKERGA